LEDRLRDTLTRLEEATARNEKLQADNEEVAEVVKSMETEIESIKGKVSTENQAADKLEELYSEVARVREDYDISQHTLRQVRADNEELRKDAESQISELMCEIEVLKSHQCATDRDNDKMAHENEQLTSQINDLEDTLRLVRANNEELRNDSQEEINGLMVEIKRLKSQQSAATSNNDEMVRENEQLTSNMNALEDTLRQVRADNEELRNDAESQINELTNQLRDLQKAAEKDAAEKSAMEQHIEKIEREMARCEQELANANNSLVSTSDEGVRERAQLCEKISSLERDNEHLTSNMNALEDNLRQVRADNEELRNDAESQINELTNQLRDLQKAAEKDATEKSAMEQHIDKIEKEMARCEQELANVNNSLESSSDEGVRERAQLCEKISSLERDNDELSKQLCDAEEVAKKYEREKRLLLTQIEQYEQDLSCCEEELSEAKAALKSKSVQVENAVHCVESRMIEEKEGVIDLLREKLSQSVSSNNDLAEKINCLQKDNERLESGRDRMRAEIDEYQRNVQSLSLKLVNSQRLLDDAKQRGSNLEQLKSEKADLAGRLNAANEKVEKMKTQLEQAGAKLMRSHEENVILKERDSELRGSVSRVGELVDAMKRRNTELEEENDSLRIRGEALEKDIRVALAERDDAYARKEKISSERDAAIEEHENAKMKLDVLAAEFEADCETMRSKVDIMTTENKTLEDRIAILEAGKASFEYKSDRILERDNALVGQHERLMSEYQKQTKKMVDLKEQLKALTLVVKRLDLEKEQFFAERATLRETIKTMRTRLRSHKNEPSPRASPSNNKKAAFFRSKQ
jgi:chromosome segregation ATPase